MPPALPLLRLFTVRGPAEFPSRITGPVVVSALSVAASIWKLKEKSLSMPVPAFRSTVSAVIRPLPLSLMVPLALTVTRLPIAVTVPTTTSPPTVVAFKVMSPAPPATTLVAIRSALPLTVSVIVPLLLAAFWNVALPPPPWVKLIEPVPKVVRLLTASGVADVLVMMIEPATAFVSALRAVVAVLTKIPSPPSRSMLPAVSRPAPLMKPKLSGVAKASSDVSLAKIRSVPEPAFTAAFGATSSADRRTILPPFELIGALMLMMLAPLATTLPSAATRVSVPPAVDTGVLTLIEPSLTCRNSAAFGA